MKEELKEDDGSADTCRDDVVELKKEYDNKDNKSSNSRKMRKMRSRQKNVDR